MSSNVSYCRRSRPTGRQARRGDRATEPRLPCAALQPVRVARPATDHRQPVAPIGPYIRRSVEYFDVQGGSSLHHLEAIAAMRSGNPKEVRSAMNAISDVSSRLRSRWSTLDSNRSDVA